MSPEMTGMVDIFVVGVDVDVVLGAFRGTAGEGQQVKTIAIMEEECGGGEVGLIIYSGASTISNIIRADIPNSMAVFEYIPRYIFFATSIRYSTPP